MKHSVGHPKDTLSVGVVCRFAVIVIDKGLIIHNWKNGEYKVWQQEKIVYAQPYAGRSFRESGFI